LVREHHRFHGTRYEGTRSRLTVEGSCLVSRVNGSKHGIGRFEMPTLGQLRKRVRVPVAGKRRTTVRCLAGDERALHSAPEFIGAMFQVASQFNLLEMASPNVTPEVGVTRYAHDRTQGRACAIAAGAATIWRNYFARVGDSEGQTATRQLDALEPLGEALSGLLGRPVRSLWTMRNGYALATPDGLKDIGRLLSNATEAVQDDLRAELAVGLHLGVEVTDGPIGSRPIVSQAFCSALPLAYTTIAPPAWEPFAWLVLDAAYEATLLTACEAKASGGSGTVLLTRVGGGAFGNDDLWIDDAIARARGRVARASLDVRLVSFGTVQPAMQAIADRSARC